MIETNEVKSCWGATAWGLVGITVLVALVYLFGGFDPSPVLAQPAS